MDFSGLFQSFLQIFQSHEIPQLIQNLCLAVLTVLIPFAIAIFSKILQAKEKFAKLDILVMIDEVFKLKRILIAIICIFLPLFFWSILPIYLRPFEILISFLGIFMIGETIWKIYEWVKGKTFDCRLAYLKKLKSPKDMKTAWEDVWRNKEVNLQREQEFLEIFLSKIEKFLNYTSQEDNKKFNLSKNDYQQNLNVVYSLLEDFGKFSKNRPLFILLSEEIFSKILKLHFKIWSNSYKLIVQKKRPKKYLNFDGILRNLDYILKAITKRAIIEEGHYPFSLFKNLKSHINYYRKEAINKHSYMSYFFMNIFCPTFFENIADSPFSNRFHIRENYFPKEWKITKENIKNNPVSQILWDQYIEWARQRIIIKNKKNFDRKLSEVTFQFFPNVDYYTWAEILTFAVAPYSGSRIKSAIEREIIFRAITPYMGKPVHEIEKLRKEKIKNAIELGYTLLKSQFSKKDLHKYIRELEKLNNVYSQNSFEEAKRKDFLKIFKKMLSLTNKYEGK